MAKKKKVLPVSKFARVQQLGEVVAASGKILIDPASTPEQRREALTRVDALGDAGASRAVRNYGETIGQSPVGSPEFSAMEQLAATMQAERDKEALISKRRSFALAGADRE